MFVMVLRTLSEPKRVLRPRGVLIISTPLPIHLTHVWFIKLFHDICKKALPNLLSTEEYLELFTKSGFECVAGMKLLGKATPSLFKNHFDPEEWRLGTCLFGNDVTTERLRQRIGGSLQKFMADHDQTSSTGSCECLCAFQYIVRSLVRAFSWAQYDSRRRLLPKSRHIISIHLITGAVHVNCNVIVSILWPRPY